MKHLLTPAEIYNRKTKAFQAFLNTERRIIRAFFPDTGGSEHLMHNWYICASKTNPDGAKLAEWIRESAWARWQRIDDKLKVQYDRNEHILNHNHGFKPSWCDYCKAI